MRNATPLVPFIDSDACRPNLASPNPRPTLWKTSTDQKASSSSDMSAAVAMPTVPVPRLSSVGYSPNMSSSTGRSPPSASSSSYRGHPYHRCMSNGPSSSAPSSSSGPSNSHILLPPPGSLAPLRVPEQQESSSHGHGHEQRRAPSPTWPPKRPSLEGPSSTEGSRASGGVSLPSLRSLSRQTSPSAQSSAIPTPSSSSHAYHPSGSPTSVSRGRPSPPRSHPSLRPSYYEHSAQPSPYHHPASRDQRFEYEQDPYERLARSREDRSPPLRELRYAEQQHYYASQGGHASMPPHSLLHAGHPHSHHTAYSYGGAPQPGMSRRGSRSRSHSVTGGMRGGHQQRMDIDEEAAPGPGQNRRIAHLMSEQKRRESINTGFQSLRTAVPTATPTDSKAIILRKAVAHIQHLERVMAKAGVSYSPTGEWAEADRISGTMERVPSGDDGMDEDAASDEGIRTCHSITPKKDAAGGFAKKEPRWDPTASAERRRISE